ncbi:TIGR00366 family protein [Psychrobacter sp. WY6]|uniref:TIGR00366 family protein n=1 Tax=Psychrobacter sp. WY6 TaxID=2708350 RepID=UPI002022C03E|nr:TIGR00366 family protein [Psychrobacter sp. WY6]
MSFLCRHYGNDDSFGVGRCDVRSVCQRFNSGDATTFCFPQCRTRQLFVPSGGGQWAVQAPIMLEAAEMLGSDPSRVAMAVAWGDAWTNMIQPFWALPALAIAGLKAKDIMGFCVIVLIVSGVVIGLGLLFL